jgi:hypothetical protein
MAHHPPDTDRAPGRVAPQANPTDIDPVSGLSAADRALMRTRLSAMAAPRDTDDAELARLRAVLRDQRLMAHVIANVQQWPPFTPEQRDTIAALLAPRGRPARRGATRRRAA